jgi:hypothetical protein
MSNPIEILATFAQVAVALAGFSGIIIAFERRSLGSLTRLELRRLSNLFALSGFVLLASLAGIVLLHMGYFGQDLLWRSASALMLATGVPWVARDMLLIRRLSPEEKSQVVGWVIYPFYVIAAFGLLLQAINCFYGELWPVLVALVIMVMFAFQQFILLVRMGIHSD